MTSKRFLELLDEINADFSCDVLTDYSGRGMYGNTCVAVVVDREAELCILAADLMCAMDPGDEREAVRKVLARTETDSMGRRMVAYWPALRTEGV